MVGVPIGVVDSPLSNTLSGISPGHRCASLTRGTQTPFVADLSAAPDVTAPFLMPPLAAQSHVGGSGRLHVPRLAGTIFARLNPSTGSWPKTLGTMPPRDSFRINGPGF